MGFSQNASRVLVGLFDSFSLCVASALVYSRPHGPHPPPYPPLALRRQRGELPPDRKERKKGRKEPEPRSKPKGTRGTRAGRLIIERLKAPTLARARAFGQAQSAHSPRVNKSSTRIGARAYRASAVP